MRHDGQPRWRRPAGLLLGIAAAVGLAALTGAPAATGAAEAPADIRAKERSDPAAGQIIVINRKKASTEKPASTAAAIDGPAAPDPYATRPPARDSRAEKPRTLASERTAGPAARPARQGPQGGAGETVREPTSRGTAATRDGALPREAARSSERDIATSPAAEPPPLPDLNHAMRPRRLARQSDERDETYDAARRQRLDTWERKRGYGRRAEPWYDAPPYWARPRYRPYPSYREAAPRDFADGRPWRVCRRFARRCEDGFERACWRWQQQCN
jgi:hypothetical protein